jgi:hypothetical protein
VGSTAVAVPGSHPFSTPLLIVWDTLRILCVGVAIVLACTCVVLAVNRENRAYTPATALGLMTQAVFICVILGTELTSVGRVVVWWRLPTSLFGLFLSYLSVKKLLTLPVPPKQTWRPGQADYERGE